MPKIVVYQTAPVWFVKNECFMAKIDVYRSLLASDRVIGWDIKIMTSHPNSNASFINIWDRLIWRRSPNLTISSKLAAAPNWWRPGDLNVWPGGLLQATVQCVLSAVNPSGRALALTLASYAPCQGAARGASIKNVWDFGTPSLSTSPRTQNTHECHKLTWQTESLYLQFKFELSLLCVGSGYSAKTTFE